MVKTSSLNKSKLVAQSENQKIIPKTTGGAGYIPPANINNNANTIVGYSAAANTIHDMIGAPVRRFMYNTFGINLPSHTYDENDLTRNQYEFW